MDQLPQPLAGRAAKRPPWRHSHHLDRHRFVGGVRALLLAVVLPRRHDGGPRRRAWGGGGFGGGGADSPAAAVHSAAGALREVGDRDASFEGRTRALTALPPQAAEARTHARFAISAIHVSDRYALYPVVYGAIAGLAAFGGAGDFLAGGKSAHWASPWPPARSSCCRFCSNGCRCGCRWFPSASNITTRAISRIANSPRIFWRQSERKPGIVFFVSLGERYVEIIANRDVHQRCEQPAWDAIVAEFANAAATGARRRWLGRRGGPLRQIAGNALSGEMNSSLYRGGPNIFTVEKPVVPAFNRDLWRDPDWKESFCCRPVAA